MTLRLAFLPCVQLSLTSYSRRLYFTPINRIPNLSGSVKGINKTLSLPSTPIVSRLNQLVNYYSITPGNLVYPSIYILYHVYSNGNINRIKICHLPVGPSNDLYRIYPTVRAGIPALSKHPKNWSRMAPPILNASGNFPKILEPDFQNT